MIFHYISLEEFPLLLQSKIGVSSGTTAIFIFKPDVLYCILTIIKG
jgi:hypothetical protein